MLEEPPILTIRKDFPRPSAEQIAAFQGVSTGFVCDAMGGTGAMDTAIGPLGDGRDLACSAVGPAFVANNGPAEILATFAAANLIQPGDVLIAAVDGHQGCSASGDLTLGMLKNAGAAGYVTDGPVRDYDGIVEVGLPVWCTGLNPNSPFAKGPGEVGGSAVVGGRFVKSGDLIVADRNGVVVVPYEKIDAVIAQLGEVAKAEAAYEIKVKSGFREPLDLEAMLADGRAVTIE